VRRASQSWHGAHSAANGLASAHTVAYTYGDGWQWRATAARRYGPGAMTAGSADSKPQKRHDVHGMVVVACGSRGAARRGLNRQRNTK
jgi:hypothetical protein